MIMYKTNKLHTAACVAAMVLFGVLLSSCDKDDSYGKGYYQYDNNELVSIEKINGMFIRWNGNVPENKKEVIRNIVSNMVWVEGGTCLMGAQSTNPNGNNYDVNANSNEGPVHSESVGSYFISKFEVTQKEWRFITEGASTWNYNAWNDDFVPVYNITHDDVLTFISTLNSYSNIQFALPTEEQWEYAARGGNKGHGYLFSGSNSVEDVAWIHENSETRVHPVGEKQANELGLFDMSGNVWEWCQGRVLRGGSWNYYNVDSRVTSRVPDYSPSTPSIANGFRLVILSAQL